MNAYNARTLVALTIILPLVCGGRTLGTPLQLDASSRLWVKGTSTVRAFECRAGAIDARMTATSPDAVAAILGGTRAVGDVEVTVAADRLDCRNGTMNEHMLKALKATEHPTIVFRVATYELAAADSGMRVTMQGALTLGGVTREITVAGTAREATEGRMQVEGTHALHMKDFGLKPPSLMLGTMKVHDRVTVAFDLLLKD